MKMFKMSLMIFLATICSAYGSIVINADSSENEILAGPFGLFPFNSDEGAVTGNVGENGEIIEQLQTHVSNLNGNFAESEEEIRHLQLLISKLNESVVITEREWKSQNSEVEERIAKLENQNRKLENESAELKEELLDIRALLPKPVVVPAEPRSCGELFDAGVTKDGVYEIHILSWTQKMACDMTGGGWTIIQRRFNGDTDFEHDSTGYAEGFGDPNAEYWLGLGSMNLITREGTWTLRVELTDYLGESRYAEYTDFKVGGNPDYELQVGSYSGTAGDALTHLNGMAFSTSDDDRDEHPTTHCAVVYGGAWWYNACSMANLNAYFYSDQVNSKGLFWYHWKKYAPMKTTVMKIKKV